MGNILTKIQQIASNEGITIGAFERSIGASKGVLSRAIANGTDIQAKWLEKIVEIIPAILLRGFSQAKDQCSRRVLPAPMKHHALTKRREKRRKIEKNRENQRIIENILLEFISCRREALREFHSYLPAPWRAHSLPISPSWSTNASTISYQTLRAPTSLSG